MRGRPLDVVGVDRRLRYLPAMRDPRGETLYFIMTDRFCDGDPDNNLGHVAECTDPTRQNWLRYWGGDLQGILDRLDYLEALGVSAIWISPVFDQIDAVADDEGRLAAPYHGYWTKDFRRIDEHLLPRSEWGRPFSDRTLVFDRLLHAAHARGLRVLLDVVCTHTSPGAPGAPKGELYDDGRFLTSFDDDRLGWYRRNGPIVDWNDPEDLAVGELRGLADLNDDAPGFRDYILGAMGDWLDRGVDGFRIDAVKHARLAFWQLFTAEMYKRKPDAFLFGEWAGIGPWDARGVHFANASGMTLLDFSFQYAVRDVLCRGDSFRRLAELFAHDSLYDDATLLVTFLDNHDMPRLLSAGLDAELLPLAVTLLMTARGVPCLFYGTEQGLHDDRDGGADPYNRPMMSSFSLDTEVARVLPALAALRRENLAVQRGFTRELWLDDDVYAFARGHGASAVVVALNRGAAPREISLRGVLLEDGVHDDVLGGPPVRVVSETIEGLHLPARRAVVLAASAPRARGRAVALAALNGYASRLGERVVLVGDAPELGRWDPARAVPLFYVNANLWMGDVPFEESAGREVLYKYAVLDPSGAVRWEDRVPRRRRAESVAFRDRFGVHG